MTAIDDIRFVVRKSFGGIFPGRQSARIFTIGTVFLGGLVNRLCSEGYKGCAFGLITVES